MEKEKKDYETIQELIDVIKPEFLAILDKNKATKKYISNVSKLRLFGDRNHKKFIKYNSDTSLDIRNFIMSSFTLSESKEGREFWSKIIEK